MHLRASKVFRSTLRMTAFTVLMTGFFTTAKAFNLKVLDSTGADITASGSVNGPVGYRWIVEEDVTQHPAPGVSTTNILAFQMHKSYMPVVASGTFGDANTDISKWQPDPSKNYMISVMPDFKNYGSSGSPNFRASYNMSSVTLLAAPAGGTQAGSATIHVTQSPMPAAQIVAFAFEDNQPINGEPDVDGERGLAGFTVRIDDGGGRYGQIGGQVSVDVFGNPLGTTYAKDGNGNYIIDQATFQPLVLQVGSGTILTDADGYAVVQNLPPGKYGVTLIPPNGTDWIQTSTIEGQHANDAFVKFKEPNYFAEFGPPGPHVFMGFISPTQSVNSAALTGGVTITGTITVNHMNRPPNYGFYDGPVPDYTNCWVGLNATGSAVSGAVYAQPCNPDGTFSIANVPPGAYTIAVWDTALDLIFGSYGVTVNSDAATCATPTTSCDLGSIPMFTWFNRIESTVFNDPLGTAFPGDSPVGIPEIPVSIKFRDGSLDQVFKTQDDGVATFNETFPYFNWQVLEVDSTRLKSTGVTAVVDAGGPIPEDAGWAMPSEGKLNPQPQQVSTYDSNGLKTGYSGDATNPNTGNNFSRTDTGNITTQAFQGFTTGTNIIDFGKTTYNPGENGGISGTVDYATVRAEDDPRYAVSEGLEPGIPHVAIIVYPKPPAGTLLNLSDVAMFKSSWNAGGSGALQDDMKRSTKGGATFDYGDAVAYGYSDGWDDNVPSNCQGDVYTAYANGGNPNNTVGQRTATDCFDGLRNFNQVRPGTYDGHYSITKDIHGNPLPAGEYIVEVVAPRTAGNLSPYKIIKEEDKNVFFGVDFTPTILPAACVGDGSLVNPQQLYQGQGTKNLIDPAAYPIPHVVAQYLSLFPGAQKPTPLAGQTRPLCNFKDVVLSDGQNAKANFEYYTDVPIAGHFVGIILNDLANEFDQTSPQFGEKQAPSFLPVAIRDWTGQELYRIYSDEWGTYSGVVPSTMTASVPIPTGNSPSVMTLCMNDPGPIPDPNHAGRYIIDPRFDRRYSHFCYTLAYLQGTTTYLDTPVIPVSAYVGDHQNVVDCEFPDGTPKIYSVMNNGSTSNSSRYPAVPGPVIYKDQTA